MATSGFADFDADHRDLITVTKFNFYGNRIVTASSDHRMKVWDLKGDEWQLTDTWRAHDAEIRDVRINKEPTQPFSFSFFPESHCITGVVEVGVYILSIQQ